MVSAWETRFKVIVSLVYTWLILVTYSMLCFAECAPCFGQGAHHCGWFIISLFSCVPEADISSWAGRMGRSSVCATPLLQ